MSDHGERIVRHSGLIRPRLLGRLDRSRPGGLALIVGPAGFGKTTLLAQYAQRHAGPVAWLSIDASTAAQARTSELVAAAIGVDGERDGRAALRAAPADLLLVIDNADLLLGTPDEHLLEELLAATPDGGYVLLAGRRLTALNLFRQEVGGYFDVIGADQLRFRTWEVERLLADVYGEPLPPDDISLLTRRTGGWAAGLVMFHLATRGRPLRPRQRAVAALSDRWDLTRGYLARTVLAELSPAVRRFLVRTSVFDTVTASRCDRLLETTGSAGLLAELTDHHALPITTDAGAYRYHQVLRSHLLAALVDDLGERDARDWHARAARLLVAEGARAEAARSYARAGDWRAIGPLLTALGTAVDEATDEPLADLLPSWLLAEDPWLVYAEARRRLADGQLEAALDGLRRAEAMFGDDAGRSCRHERRIVTIWLRGPQPARTHWVSWLRAATRTHPGVVAGEAATLGGPEGELVRLLGEFLSGNLVEAVRRANRPLTVDWPESSVAGLALRVTRAALALLGEADPARRNAPALDLAQLADEADAAGLPWLSRMARAACGLAGDPVLAAEARAVADECERRGDRWGAVLAAAVCCLHDLGQGRLDPADAGRLLTRCRDLDAGVLQTWAQAWFALAAATDGLPEAEVEARAAAHHAASAGVPGAHVAATAALARSVPGQRGRLLAEAASQAAAAGIPAAVVRCWSGGDAPAGAVATVGPMTPPAAAVPAAELSGLAEPLADLAEAGFAASDAVPAEPAVPDREWLRISCFGSFRLEIEGRPVDLSGVRARARSALRLLATSAGQGVHREVLIESLWPDLSPSAATRNLQVTISALRVLLDRAAGPGRPSLLVRSDGAYRLMLPPGGYCDTVAFQAAVARWRRLRAGGDRAAEATALRQALACYGGDLLPEEGPAEWAVTARDQFRRQATELSRALASLELARGEVAEAIIAAEHCLALDQFDDTAWNVLLDGYARAGAPAKAAEARRRYAAMLANLGIGPAQPRSHHRPGNYGGPHGRMNSSSSAMATRRVGSTP